MTKGLPFVSVVVPARNEEKLLAQCLNSLQEQDYAGKYEIIVVDNASTDRTYDIASSFGVKVVREANIGTGPARQRGLHEAMGEIVAFTDADTVVPRFWLTTLVQRLTQGSEVVAVTGPYAFFDVGPMARALSYLINFIFINLDNAFRFAMRKGGTLWGSNFAIKKQTLVEVGGFDATIKYLGEDYDLSLRLIRKGRVSLLSRLFVLTSARRLKEQGLLCTYWNYVVNYFSILFWHRPLSQNLEDLPRKVAKSLLKRLHSVHGYGGVVRCGDGRSRQIALTFDDGPNEPFTSRILDILKEYGIKATFFLIGENAERFPELCQRIRKGGHIIGNHSYCHSWWLALSRGKDIAEELQLAQEVIYRASGGKPELFRPPYGLWTPWLLKAAQKLGLKVITWNNMTADWKPDREASDIAAAILKRARPGSIIVLHDGRAHRQSYDRTALVVALPLILTALKRQEYEFVTVPELLKSKSSQGG